MSDHSTFSGCTDTLDAFDDIAYADQRKLFEANLTILDPDNLSVPTKTRHGTTKTIEVEDVGSDTSHKYLSHSLLTAFSTCQLKGSYTYANEPRLEPTKFAEEHMTGGNIFESEAINALAQWIKRISTAVRKKCIYNLPERLGESAEVTSKAITAVTTGNPQIFVNVSLNSSVVQGESISGIRGKAVMGIIDLLLWTGDVWIIGDIKCSESARTSYGNQVTLYATLWKLLYPTQPLYPVGFIAHCTPGQLYQIASSDTAKARAVANIMVQPIVYDLFANNLKEAFSTIQDPSHERVFTSLCIECGFRYDCYPNFLSNTSTDISLFPDLEQSDIKLLKKQGIDTVEKLVTLLNKSQLPEALEITYKQEHIPYLLGRAEVVIEYKGFCSAKLDSDVLDSCALVCYSEKSKSQIISVIDVNLTSKRIPLKDVTEEWFQQHLGAFPKYIIAYRPNDANCVYHIEGGKLEKIKAVRISLLELLRDYVHLPFSSYSLSEAAYSLQAVAIKELPKFLLENWSERIDSVDSRSTILKLVDVQKMAIRPLPNVSAISLLELAVYSLVEFSAICRKGELKYVSTI